MPDVLPPATDIDQTNTTATTTTVTSTAVSCSDAAVSCSGPGEVTYDESDEGGSGTTSPDLMDPQLLYVTLKEVTATHYYY